MAGTEAAEPGAGSQRDAPRSDGAKEPRRLSHLELAQPVAVALALAAWIGLALVRVQDAKGGNCGNLWDPRRAEAGGDNDRAGILADLFGWTVHGFEPLAGTECADLLNERRRLVLLAAGVAAAVGLVFGPSLVRTYQTAIATHSKAGKQRIAAQAQRQQEDTARRRAALAAYDEQLNALALRTGLTTCEIAAMADRGRRGDIDERTSHLRDLDRRLAANSYRLPINSWQAAERAAAAWMRTNGWPDAELTRRGPDGGIDVQGSGCAAQVKWHNSTISLAVIQQLAGAAAGRKALFFARQRGQQSPYTKPATIWAREHDVALYSLDAAGQVRCWTDN